MDIKNYVKNIYKKSNSIKIFDLRFLILSVTFTMSLFMMESESDSFWSLRAGKDFLAGKNIWKDSWTYTSMGNYWPNHEWLYEVINYCLYIISFHQYFLIIIAHAILITASLGLILYLKDDTGKYYLKLNSISIFLYSLISLIVLYYFDRLRAISVSLFLTIVVSQLILKGSLKYLPLIILLWANLHGGVTIFFPLFASMIIIDYFMSHDNNTRKSNLIYQLKIFLLCFVLTFINPMGYRLWAYVLNSGINKNMYYLTEWRPMYKFMELLMPCTLMMSLTLFGLIKNHNSKKYVILTTWSIILFIFALLHVRFAGIFMLISLTAISKILGKIDNNNINGKKIFTLTLNFIILIPISLLIGQINSDLRETLPQSIIQEVSSCKGHIWNSYSIGGDFEWFTPNVKVFQDSRYDYLSNDLKNRANLANSNDWEEFLRKNNVNCVVVVDNDELFPKIKKSQNWAQERSDGEFTVFVRSH